MKLKDSIIEVSEHWVALNKPSGLLSIPDREGKEISLKKILEEHYGSIFTVHRLDKDTSGLILYARNEETHKFLSQQFSERQTEKIYTGIVMGVPSVKKTTISAPIMEHPAKKGLMVIHRNGKESVTEYEVMEEFGICSLLQFSILTGRTHQIRVHMKDTGHPILCDPLYGDGNPLLLSSIKKKYTLSRKYDEEKPLMNRLALHARRLSFTDPGGSRVQLEAPLQKDLAATLNQLSKFYSKKRS